jgi:hypothetical protein
MVRFDNQTLFKEYKLSLEHIIRSSEGKSGYVAVHSVPHVLAGFLYMSASVAALHFQSWEVFNNLLNAKFEWNYQSDRPLYSRGFDVDQFFHSFTFNRSASKIHDFYRSEITRIHAIEILGLSNEQFLDVYNQTQMVMCLRATQEEDSIVFPDFGRFYEHRVLKLLDKVFHDRDYAKGLCISFNETPEEWLEKLNDRLKIVHKWFGSASYPWNSIRQYEPR